MNHKYLTVRSKACGQISMLHLKTDLTPIRQKYNFAKRGKVIVDKIMKQFEAVKKVKSSSEKEKLSRITKKRIVSLNQSRRSKKYRK